MMNLVKMLIAAKIVNLIARDYQLCGHPTLSRDLVHKFMGAVCRVAGVSE